MGRGSLNIIAVENAIRSGKGIHTMTSTTPRYILKILNAGLLAAKAFYLDGRRRVRGVCSRPFGGLFGSLSGLQENQGDFIAGAIRPHLLN